jgi:hypothetical protein
LKATCRVLTATAFLLLPAFLISSCDDKNPTPVGPSDDPTISDIEAPSFTTVGFGSKWHDPHIKGPKVRTFTNNPAGFLGCQTSEKRFKSEDGAELKVTIGEEELTSAEVTSAEDFCDAGVYPVDQKIRGKLLTAVKELDFSYAGGDENGAPQMRIPIDCDAVEQGEVEECPTTDGTMEFYAYIDARTCNDGDANVGVVNAEDKEYCTVEYNGYYYDSWQLFVDAHSNGRVARKLQDLFTDELVDARTSVVLSPLFQFLPGTPQEGPIEPSPHYLIWMVDVR